MMTRKTIALPGMYDLDIKPIMPIIDTPAFQQLRRKRQLENAALVFVGANHTRFEHSLGTYSMTLERVSRWRHDGVISEQEAHDLALFGLLHDIGHGPYSHATEALTGYSHHDIGVRRLDELADALEKCGSNVSRIKPFFSGDNPLAIGVTHRPLGTDKLDYVTRDARYTSEAVRMRVGDILNHAYYVDGQLVIDRKIIPEATQAQSDYAYMHERVYLRRSALIAKRFFQKIVSLEMSTNSSRNADWLWRIDDAELDAALLCSSNAQVRQLFRRLQDRCLPKMALALLPTGVVTTDRTSGKAIATREVAPETLSQFNSFHSPHNAAHLETEIARYLVLPPEAVLVIPVVTPERFTPYEVLVYDGPTCLGTLQELRPGHYQHLAEVAQGYAAVRVCVFPEYREAVAEPATADRVFDILLEAAAAAT